MRSNPGDLASSPPGSIFLAERLIVERYSIGGNISILSLSREFGVSRRFVYRTLERHFIPVRRYDQRKPPREVVCVGCGQTFQVERHRTSQRFCSRHCAITRRPENAERYRRKTRRCPNCGTDFHRHNRETIYCSRECDRASKRKTCPICGKDYLPRRQSGKEQPTCSRTCQREVLRVGQPACKGCGKRLPLPSERWKPGSPFCSRVASEGSEDFPTGEGILASRESTSSRTDAPSSRASGSQF